MRLAAVGEAEAIASVLRDAFADFEPLYTPAAFAATTPNAEQIRGRWGEGPVWVALVDGCVEGTVAAVVKGRGLYVRSMGVRPASRGLGLGRRLLDGLERYAVGEGCSRMYLSTTPFLYGAIRLYERFGFEFNKEGPFELSGTPLLTMAKPLTIR